MRKDDIILTKGNNSVTLFTVKDAENFKNALQVVPGTVSPDNQASGSKKSTVLDLLRIIHTYQFEGYIVETNAISALTAKNTLKLIFNGSGVNSTPATLTYEDESIDVFCEDLVILGVNNDDAVENGYDGEDSPEYHVTLTLIEGKLVSG